ncbi:taxadiene 5-alpha hydroxylase-like [Gastrolobium bilobum]|uniref:taxadiene 5-alpha hydroxylase-like n=1 Tax=Gastrolobium bilobum TaxID=150636 RepID=UPI002AB043C0|nr:taxadiene 5-alpha hydroxylase-like [Gastrolobium bilobum]
MSVLLVSFLLLIPILLLHRIRRKPSKRVPPGSLGIPIIGQSLGLLRAMRANVAEKWIEERTKKYGPISKLSLFGKPTVFIYGQAANKLIFQNSGNTIVNQQTQSIKMILGDRNLMELSGEDHSRVRNALVSFLKPESLKLYVGKMDEEVKRHLEMHWHGKQQIKVLPLMKTMTFNIICSLLFGIERGKQRDEFLACFKAMMGGMWSVPVNVPFTRYNRSLRASARIQNMMEEIVHKKKIELEQNGASAHKDLISCLLGMVGEDDKQVITEKEIIHNVRLVMVAGYDTSSVVITFIIRLLSNEPAIYAAVLQEQEEIAKSKPSGETLTWEDISKMKYTWRVAMETLRMIPPVFGGFRKAVADIEYGGYLIPKGWQIFWVTAMTHMDNSIFSEPSKFDPSRFENQASVPPYCFIPFGGGARMCPGYEFARVEILVAIHYIVTRFSWKLCSDNFFSRDPTPVPTQGLLVEIWPRKLS